NIRKHECDPCDNLQKAPPAARILYDCYHKVEWLRCHYDAAKKGGILMQTQVLVAIAVLVVIVVALAALYAVRQQRSSRLRRRFGPEYDRTVESTGDQKRAEQELADREQRRRRFQVHELEPEARDRYWAEWRQVQARFVDQPQLAVREADVLVTEVMRRRGYPMDDFEQAAA